MICLAVATTLTAGQIFAKARLAMYLHRYPRFISYVVDVESTAYGKHYREGYSTTLRTHDGAIVVTRLPLYTSNKPENPYGFNLFGTNPHGRPADHIEPPFGIPVMSPTFAFDIGRAPEPRSVERPSTASSIPVIGYVTVAGGDYNVEVAGEEAIDGHDAYHLTLTPLREPSENTLRDLWIDMKTFDTWRLSTDGIFRTGAGSNSKWIVTFVQTGGYWFIGSESTADSFTRGGGILGIGSTEYRGVQYTFENLEFPKFIPDIMFFNTYVDTDAIQH